MKAALILAILYLLSFFETAVYAKGNYPKSYLIASYNKSTSNLEKYQISDSLADSYIFYNSELSVVWRKKALQHSEILKDKIKIATQSNILADLYKQLNNKDSSAIYYEKAIHFYEQLKLTNDIFKCIDPLETMLLDLGKYAKAHDLITKKLKLSNAIKSSQKQANCYKEYGELYYYMGDYYMAQENYLKALDLCKQGNFDYDLNIIYYDIANLYFAIGDFKNSETYLQLALSKFKVYEKGFPDDKISYAATIYKKIALLDIETGNYKRALQYCDSAYTLLKGGQSVAWVYTHLGTIYTRLNNYPKAKENFDLAMKYMVECNFCWWSIYNDISEYYYHFGKYDSAIYYCNKTLTRSFTYREDIRVLKTNLILSKIYHSIGNDDSAYKYSQKYIELYDKALSRKKLSLIKNAESQYYLSKKEDRINFLQQENIQNTYNLAKQRLIIYFSLIFILIISALLFIIYKNQKQKQRILKHEKELALINSYINGQEKERERISKELHDGIGSDLAGLKIILNNAINDKLLVGKDIIRKISNISKEVRIISHNLSSPLFVESNFQYVLQDYIDQFTCNSTLNIDLLFYPQINWSEIRTDVQRELYRIVQEIVNNSIKHSGANYLLIQITKQEKVINLMIEDNGKGFLMDFKNSGNGLKNIKVRVELLNGEMNMESLPGKSTMFSIDIPLEQIKIATPAYE